MGPTDLFNVTSANALTHFGIVAAIPTMWKVILHNNPLREEIDYIAPLEKYLALGNVSRVIYWQLIENKMVNHDTDRYRWQMDLGIQILEEQWWSLFLQLCKFVKPTKLRYF